MIRTAVTNNPDQRMFATGTRGGTGVVYDPLTGQSYRLPTPVSAPARIALDPATVESYPEVHPGDLGGAVPVSVCWSPIVRCNLSCPHCLDDKSVPELPRERRAHVAAMLGGSGVLGVDISGGEPLLLRDLADLADLLIRGGCAVSVTTNGTHLARRADALASHLDAIRVSLDGPTAETHDRWRGDGSFTDAISGIRAAVAHNIPTQIQTVLMRSTITSIRAMVDLAATLGATGVTFLQFLPIGEGTAIASDEQLSDKEAAERIAELGEVPVAVRLRTRAAAAGFTVVRADGLVWRNDADVAAINRLRPLTHTSSLTLSGRDGSA
ncbi:radical SAM protein [Actinokineospora sp. NBRC 105648]|uniref:radical SAM protein n=1 Tax=Actinokineospora sp. NBRC 105648 TaxID=3032206 RepID=UPI0024A4B3D8|nr:radical SAM protein [Actinokineospora sp. NBRC 105648]GLZ37894.1 hypothetical protein Acsp05_15180 [Actinokineospora sp. NBRC 105648]